MRANFLAGCCELFASHSGFEKAVLGSTEAVVLNCSLDEQESASASRQCRYSSLFVEATGLAGGSTS